MDFGAAPNFTYFAHPRIHHIFPSAGASGVLVRVHGESLNLRASSAYGVGYFDGATATPRCSFGGVEVPASAVGAVGAELSSQLLCISPALDARAPVRLSVSLNGQEYTNETVRSSPSPSPSPRPSSSPMPNPSPNPNTEPNPDPTPTPTPTPKQVPLYKDASGQLQEAPVQTKYAGFKVSQPTAFVKKHPRMVQLGMLAIKIGIKIAAAQLAVNLPAATLDALGPTTDGLINEMLTMSCEAMKEVAEDDEKMDECAAPPLFLGHAHSSPPRPQRCPAHSSPPRP